MTLEERVPKMRNTCNLPFMVLGGRDVRFCPLLRSAPGKIQRIGPWGAHMVELIVATLITIVLAIGLIYVMALLFAFTVVAPIQAIAVFLPKAREKRWREVEREKYWRGTEAEQGEWRERLYSGTPESRAEWRRKLWRDKA